MPMAKKNIKSVSKILIKKAGISGPKNGPDRGRPDRDRPDRAGPEIGP